MIRWHARIHQQRDQPCPSHITRKGITPEHAGALAQAPALSRVEAACGVLLFPFSA
jgi:hypothetical protein